MYITRTILTGFFFLYSSVFYFSLKISSDVNCFSLNHHSFFLLGIEFVIETIGNYFFQDRNNGLQYINLVSGLHEA